MAKFNDITISKMHENPIFYFPNNNKIKNHRAFILTSIQRYGEAITIYEKFIDEDYSLDGQKLRKEVMKQMYPHSELEIKLEPIFKSAKSFKVKHEFSQALRYYENILLIDKYNFEALTGIIRVSTISDNHDEAKKIMKN